MNRKSIFRPGRGSLTLICLFFFGSALIRLGLEAGQALATEGTPEQISDATEANTLSPVEAATREDFSKLIELFQEREQRIEAKEKQLMEQEQQIDLARAEIQEQLAAMEEAENSLRSLLALSSTAAEDDLARLTAMYENMKPKEAAKLFEEMEPGFAAGFLARMRADAAAGIMAGLDPQTAYSISVILAGRNAEAPKG